MDERKMKRYLRAVRRRLNLPKSIRERVMSDFESDIQARREAGHTDEAIFAELGASKKAAAELNEQMKEFAWRKSPWRYLFGALAVVSGGWLILYAILQRFGMLLNTLSWSFSPSESASIGIIGGADGPTSIFVAGVTTTGHGLDWDVLLVAAILLGSIWAFLRLRRCKPKT